MRIRGLQPRGSYSSVCELPRPGGAPIALRMQPLRLGFARGLRERGLVSPEPPLRVARDSAGRPLKDERGQAVMTAAETDADFARTLEQYHQRVAVLAVVESLEADAEVAFAAPRPSGNDGWVEYADAVYAEMEEAGFTAGDLVHLCAYACRLSNLAGDHLRESRAGFLGGNGERDGIEAGPHGLRTVDYLVLRTCERLGMPEREFLSLPYAEQLRLLAYGWLRINEERGETETPR